MSNRLSCEQRRSSAGGADLAVGVEHVELGVAAREARLAAGEVAPPAVRRREVCHPREDRVQRRVAEAAGRGVSD